MGAVILINLTLQIHHTILTQHGCIVAPRSGWVLVGGRLSHKGVEKQMWNRWGHLKSLSAISKKNPPTTSLKVSQTITRSHGSSSSQASMATVYQISILRSPWQQCINYPFFGVCIQKNTWNLPVDSPVVSFSSPISHS